ncbi:MAG: glycosyltransferase 87 family protein [Myxococcaceae bacterium]|nr:glycosyltransferase 87 family protein [Myxococcaceae bacterium]
MSHYLSGILKIITIEAFMALLVIDRLVGEKHERARHLAFSLLATVMAFGWTNWGTGRQGLDLGWIAGAIPVVWLCHWLIRAALGRETSERAQQVKERLTQAGRPLKAPPLVVASVLCAALAVGYSYFAVGHDGVSTSVVRVSCPAECDASLAGAPGRRVGQGVWEFAPVRPGPAQLDVPGRASGTLDVPAAAIIEVSAADGRLSVTSSRTRPIPAWVHQHEQFHFYLGAKYQKEVGWFDLYIAAIMADRETINAMANVTKTRDNHTFEEMPVEKALEQAPRIRAKFSDERWAAFKADWVTMVRAWPWMNWTGVMNDHGNSNSPAWSLVATPIASVVPLSIPNQSLLGCIDLWLMLALFLALYETFGVRQASAALFMWACVPVVFDYLGGSFLRWDWLFALGLSACFLHKERWGTAGALFGFSVATKLFPLFFGVALLVRVAFEAAKTKQLDPKWLAFGRNAAIAVVACVVLSTVFFGASAWPEYVERIQVAQVEKFYSNQHSLKTVFLQFVAPGESPLTSGLFPPVIKQSLPDVDIKDYAFGFLLARLALTAVIVVLLRRASYLEAFTLGPLLVFTWLTVNMYYWNMLSLLALGLVARPQKHFLVMLLGLFGAYITYYTYQHLNRGFAEGYLVATIMLGLIVGTAVAEWRDQRQAAAVT